MRAMRQAGARRWWCLGDLVGYGADPTYCLGLCISEAERCLAGNHDLGASEQIALDHFASWARTSVEWTRQVLGPVGRAKLDKLRPVDIEHDYPLYHASPRDPVWEYVLSNDQARAALEDRRVPLTCIGHTHVQSAWRLRPDGAVDAVPLAAGVTIEMADSRWLINPGSVGQPRDGDPRAAWALFDTEARSITFRRTPYDVAAAQNAILEAGLPAILATRLSEGL